MYNGEDIKQNQENRRNTILKAFGEDSDSIEKAGEGSRGGNVIGHTKSGKPIYSSQNAKNEKSYSSKDHDDAAYAHLDKQVEHNKLSLKHKADKNKSDFHSNEAGIHSREYERHMSSKEHKKLNESLEKSEGDDDKSVTQEEKEHSGTYSKLKSDAEDGKLNTTKKEFAEDIKGDHEKEEKSKTK